MRAFNRLFIRFGPRKLELRSFSDSPENRMNIHHNARLTPLGRERMVRAIVEGGQTPQAAARAAGVCPRTARKWVARFKAEGLAGLADRSSRPQRLPQPTSPAVVDQVIALRRRRLPGQHIAKAAGVSPGEYLDRRHHSRNVSCCDCRSASISEPAFQPKRVMVLHSYGQNFNLGALGAGRFVVN